MEQPTWKTCPTCRELYNSLTDEDKKRGVGSIHGHLLTHKGDCPKGWEIHRKS